MKLAGLVKKARSRQGVSAGPAGHPAVLFPGPEGWEMWNGSNGQAARSGPADQPRKLRPDPGCILAIPSRSFYSMPLWVPVVEESPAREQTQMRLELKGMLGANPESAVWAFEGLRQEPLPSGGEDLPVTRQLEAVAVLATPFQDAWLVEEAVRYEPAGRMLPAPGSGCFGVLRRELGRWVADFYLGGKWLHTQPLLTPALEGTAAAELNTVVAQLEGEGVVTRLDGWWVREEETVPSAEFRKALGAPLQVGARVPPALPALPWNLPPPALTELRGRRAQKIQQAKIIRTGLIVYGGLLVLGLGLFGWSWGRLKMKERELARIGAEAESIQATAMLWREAGAWLDPRRNALELLWQVSRPLIEQEPPLIERVRLTLFDLNSRRLLLTGEGDDLEVVEKYFQWLKAEPALAGFNWKNAPPRVLPSGKAQFTTEGLVPGVSAGAEEGGEGENTDRP